MSDSNPPPGDLIIIDGDAQIEILFPARPLPEIPADDPDHGCGGFVVAVLGDLRPLTFTCTREKNHDGAHVAHGLDGGPLVAMARWSKAS